MWVNAEIILKRLLSNRRLRSTFTSSSTTRPEKTDHGRNRSGAQLASARLQSPGRSGGAGRDRTNSSSAANEISVDFEQSQEAYRSKDSLELLRSLVVFKLLKSDASRPHEGVSIKHQGCFSIQRLRSSNTMTLYGMPQDQKCSQRNVNSQSLMQLAFLMLPQS
uniref:Uncharacterized protein n=1 Tax=Xiphophorus couchianus TaxID=32473 RepID=A0A3B5LN98_9TELE